MSFLARLLGDDRERAALQPLYDGAVALARDPVWYRAGVPDTIDGRFDMLSAVVALLLLRLEEEGEKAKAEGVLLTELFVDDMEATLRELGIGDAAMGKRIGKLLGALGGRLGSFREGLGDVQLFEAAVRRNVLRDAPGSEAVAAVVAERLRGLNDKLRTVPREALLAGKLPAL